MPRRKSSPAVEQTYEDAPPIRIGGGPSGSPREHHYDPLQVMPGGVIREEKPMKKVKDQRVRARPGERQAQRDLYQSYLNTLVAKRGDIIESLMATLGVTFEEAYENAATLHAEILSGAGQVSLQETLKRYDLSREARLAVLRAHLYSEVPAASLKAVDLLNDMDVNQTADGGSYESHLRLLLSETK